MPLGQGVSVARYMLASIAQRSGFFAGEPPESTTCEQNEKRLDWGTKTHNPIEDEILDNGQRDCRVDNQELLLTVLPGDEQTKDCQEEDRDWHEKGHISYHLR